MSRETLLHVGFFRDGSEKMILSVNPDRDTSAAWASRHREIAPGWKVHMWFYGVKKEDLVDVIFEQTKRALLDGSFKKWFQ